MHKPDLSDLTDETRKITKPVISTAIAGRPWVAEIRERMRVVVIVSITCGSASAALPTSAADGPDTPTSAPAAVNADAAYTRVLEKRAADVLDVLALKDPVKAARVREAVITQYRALRRLHDARDTTIESLRNRPGADKAELDKQIKAERERTDAAAAALHKQFLATLSADLSPEQVDQVKDKMTYNKLQVTYNAYNEMLPDLTPEQKRMVFGMLKEAREAATYAGSAEEKSEIFNKYKGRINNNLAAQGYDMKLASKRWAERRKEAK